MHPTRPAPVRRTNTQPLNYQRGFLLIMAVVLIVVAALLLTMMMFLGVTATESSASHLQSTRALFVAESGMERALHGFSKEGTACASLTYTASFGDGNFSTTGTLYAPAATTLSAAISATDTIIPVASVAGYGPHGRLTIETESINYAGSSTTSCGAFATPCFTGAQRGAAGSTAAAHALGAAVNQNQCLLRSTGTMDSAKRTVESAVTAGASKNVQSGNVTMNSPTRTVTLGTAVNTARAFVLCYNRTDTSDPTNRVTCELTNATTVTVRAGATNVDNVVQWYVVEFGSGMTVQRGLTTLCAGNGAACRTVNVPLSTVDTTKTFVLVTERITESAQDNDERWTVQARLTSATNLELARGQGGTALSVAWQVIEMNDASVQSGLTSIVDGVSSNTAGITAVDPTKSFLVFSRRAASNVAGVEGRYQVRGELTNGTTLTFTRARNQRQIDIAWFVVTLNDGTTVQRGTAAVVAGDNMEVVTLAPAVALNRSFPVVSASGANSTESGDLDSTCWTPAFISTTNLQLQRTPAGGGTQIGSSVAWFTINLGGSPTRIDWSEVYP